MGDDSGYIAVEFTEPPLVPMSYLTLSSMRPFMRSRVVAGAFEREYWRRFPEGRDE